MREVNARHRAHRRNAREQEDRVSLCQPRLNAEQNGACHHQRRNQRRAARYEGERSPIGQQHRTNRTQQRWQPIQPDRGARLGHACRFAEFDGRRLQPIDADRLFVPDLVLKADVDILAALQHLFGGLRKARLVAVDRRDLEKARQERDERKRNEQRGGSRMRAARPIQNGQEAACPHDSGGSVVGGEAHGRTSVF